MKLQKIILFIGLTLGLTTFSWAQHPGDKPGDLPDNVDTADCTSKPPAKAFDIKLKWQTKKYTGENDPYSNGRSTPLVADVDGDGEVEVIVPWAPLCDASHNHNGNNSLRPNTFITHNLNVINGKTGEFKYMIKTCDYSVHGQTVALADVDGDGKCEVYILAVGPKNPLRNKHTMTSICIVMMPAKPIPVPTIINGRALKSLNTPIFPTLPI